MRAPAQVVEAGAASELERVSSSFLLQARAAMEIMAVGAAAAAIPQPTAEMVDLAAAVGVVQRHNQTYLDLVLRREWWFWRRRWNGRGWIPGDKRGTGAEKIGAVKQATTSVGAVAHWVERFSITREASLSGTLPSATILSTAEIPAACPQRRCRRRRGYLFPLWATECRVLNH